MNSKVYDYFASELEQLHPAMAWNATTVEAHQAWRQTFKAKVVELLGRQPERVPLDVKWDETVETDAFTRKKVYIRSEANYWVPAYYFVPKGIEGKRPAIICFHGHSGIFPYIHEGTDAEKKKCEENELDYALHFAEHGYITIAVVQRGWNETSHDKPNSCERLARDGFMTGKTPIGMRCWDAARVLDFLENRDEVDASRIGAAGLSGGGTTTLFFTAIDDRVKVALCAGYFCTFKDSIYDLHHCICNCVPHLMEYGEMSDIAALVAPRPLLVISGTKDPIFPIDATRRAFDTLAKTYELLGARDNLDSDFFEGEHEWSNQKTLPFLEKHFGRADGGAKPGK